jgi:hypothetical protein
MIGDDWDDDEAFEDAVVLPVASQPIRPVLGRLEPCLVLRSDNFLHLREVGSGFSLCGARTAQALQHDDTRLKLPACPLCEVASGRDSE